MLRKHNVVLFDGSSNEEGDKKPSADVIAAITADS